MIKLIFDTDNIYKFTLYPFDFFKNKKLYLSTESLSDFDIDPGKENIKYEDGKYTFDIIRDSEYEIKCNAIINKCIGNELYLYLYNICDKEDEEPKRKNYISWDKYFMELAEVSSKRSKDPKTQVGACIERNNKILSLGYNGFPNGCSDDEFPWNSKSNNYLKLKNTYVVHAELNAILSYRGSVEDSTIYVTLFPCNECAKAIIQSGIKKVIYKKRKHTQIEEASIKMFEAAGVEYISYDELT